MLSPVNSILWSIYRERYSSFFKCPYHHLPNGILKIYLLLKLVSSSQPPHLPSQSLFTCLCSSYFFMSLSFSNMPIKISCIMQVFLSFILLLLLFFFYLPPSAEDTFLFRSSLILKCLDKKLGHIIGTDECILNEWMKNIQIDVPFFKPLTRWESIFLCMLRSLTWFVVTLKSTFILYSLLLKC